MMKKRILFIDELRGFAILLVVMGHVLENNGYRSFLYNFIYSFHMPLFFCISGFVTMYACNITRESSFNEYVVFLWRKFLSIMLPCIVWSLIVNTLFFSNSFSQDRLVKAFRVQFIDNGGYWFLPCLFNLILLFSLWKFFTDRWNKKKKVTIDVLFLSMIWGGVILLSPINYVRSVCSYFVPFFVGVMMCRYSTLYRMMVESRCCYAICLFLFCLIAGYYGNVYYDGFLVKIIRLTTGVLALPLFFYLFSHCKFKSFVEKSFTLLGNYTLIVYLLHFRFTREIPVPDNMGLWSQIIVFSLVSFIMCFSIVLLAKIIEKAPLLSLLLLGKRK